jgi:hypothetical protein
MQAFLLASMEQSQLIDQFVIFALSFYFSGGSKSRIYHPQNNHMVLLSRVANLKISSQPRNSRRIQQGQCTGYKLDNRYVEIELKYRRYN